MKCLQVVVITFKAWDLASTSLRSEKGEAQSFDGDEYENKWVYDLRLHMEIF